MPIKTPVKVKPVQTTTAITVPPDVEKESTSVVKQAKALQVVDSPSYEVAGDFLRTIKSASLKIDEVFDGPIEQAHKAHKAMLTAKKTFSVPLSEAEDNVKQKRKVWFNEQERIRLVEQRRLEQEAFAAAEAQREAELAELRKQHKYRAAKQVQQAELVVEAVALVPPTVAREDGIGKTRRWKYKVVDESLIPDEWWVLNEVALGKLARSSGETAVVPGVEFYSEIEDQVRAWS